MTIGSLADYRSAPRQSVDFVKAIGNGTANLASGFFSGTVPAAASALANTSNGVVPVAGDSGFPAIAPLSGTPYITRIDWSASAAARSWLYDRLWHAGPYDLTSNVTLSSQPSFSSRLPGGSYAGLVLLLEKTNTLASAATLTVGYTNESGTSGRTSGSVSVTSAANGVQLIPLASGDCGVRSVDSVVCSPTGSASSFFNIIIARPLLEFRVDDASSLYLRNQIVTRPTQIFSNSALCLRTYSDTSAAFNLSLQVEIASK